MKKVLLMLFAAVSDGSQYVLASVNDVVGFYKTASGTPIPAGKAYITSGAGIKAFYFDGDEATGIDSLTPTLSEGEGAIYNVAGQRLQKMQRGINIVGGKKILY
ncbi:MAG: hypothetical protein IKP36_01920 [Bacteroidaceae bacterium]|nr:hypothetical protein [Bacteroidaceae bacterium]